MKEQLSLNISILFKSLFNISIDKNKIFNQIQIFSEILYKNNKKKKIKMSSCILISFFI